MNLRATRRAGVLGWALASSISGYALTRLRGPLSLEQRALWLNSMATGVLKALGIRCRIHGQPPARGLVVSNHLSYLDIAIFSATIPCFFVSKAEIGQWPFFGWTARTGATIFIDRSSRASAANVAAQMAERLRLSVPVLFFPEGTSTDGSHVLRFHSTLFEPAVVAGTPITAASICYILEDGRQERDLCWYDDMHFITHLWKALAAPGFSAEVCFGDPHTYPDRRTAANQTHAEVAAMRTRQVREDGVASKDRCLQT